MVHLGDDAFRYIVVFAEEDAVMKKHYAIRKNKVVFMVTVISALLSSCSYELGGLENSNRFTFPNSNVKQVPDGNVQFETSRTIFLWEDQPLEEMYDELLTKAMNETDGAMLINLKWKTKTTMWQVVPVLSLTVNLEATAVDAEVFRGRLY